MMLVTAVLVILVGAGGFFGGMKYQQSKGGRGADGQPGANGQRRGQFGQRNGMRPVAGDIISADDKSITVKMMDGSTKIVLISGSTQINKAATATKTDLKPNEKVAVFGTENSDGSVTAQSIQLNPMFRGPMGTPSAAPN